MARAFESSNGGVADHEREIECLRTELGRAYRGARFFSQGGLEDERLILPRAHWPQADCAVSVGNASCNNLGTAHAQRHP
jgi:hypothetical protein